MHWKHRKNHLALYLIAFLLLLFILAIGPQKIIWAGQQVYNRWMILTLILDKIERFYVEEKDPDSLIEDAIQGMLNGLDPHSVYLPAEDYAEWQKKYQGFHGIGLKYNIIGSKLVVVSLFEDGPALAAGVQMGDIIIEIEGQDVSKLKSEQIAALLVGPLDSKISLVVERKNVKEPIHFEIPRKSIVVESIPCAFMFNDTTGYIKIAQFSESTPTELDLAFAQLREQGMAQLLLDLRDNSGGPFQAGIEVADRFIPGGKLLLFTKGRTPSSTEQFISSQSSTLPMLPLIVMVNEASASDAEIVAGVIQDWDRGLLVGRPTYGKALVQTEYPFQDGSALLLTTARYYTPLGRMIQREYSSNGNRQDMTKSNRSSGAVSLKDQKVFTTPKGRILTAEGGITPDVILEPEEITLSEAFKRIYFAKASYFYTFAADYVNGHPELRGEISTFLKEFHVTEPILNEFFQSVVASGLRFTMQDLNENSDQIKLIIKREIAGVIWGEQGRHITSASEDKEIIHASQLFSKAKQLITY